MRRSPEDLLARFVPGGGGSILVVARGELREGSRCVLLVPPLFEELNKTRLSYSLLSRELVASGLAAVVFDLYGTGDSSGEFRQASWELWKSDLQAVVAWLARHGVVLQDVLATRGGALLTGEYLAESGTQVERLGLWQPVLSGEQYLTQFLRTRIAANAFRGRPKESVQDLVGTLKRGGTVEVGGYELSPGIANGLLGAALDRAIVSTRIGRVCAFQVGRQRSPALDRLNAALAPAGREVAVVTTDGPAFWATAEISTAPELIKCTAAWFSGGP